LFALGTTQMRASLVAIQSTLDFLTIESPVMREFLILCRNDCQRQIRRNLLGRHQSVVNGALMNQPVLEQEDTGRRVDPAQWATSIAVKNTTAIARRNNYLRINFMCAAVSVAENSIAESDICPGTYPLLRIGRKVRAAGFQPMSRNSFLRKACDGSVLSDYRSIP
jgi:hypothetical protein